jgi:hypothetical protein
MSMKPRGLERDIESDPFGERTGNAMSRTLHLLGGRFRFESDNRDLLRLVDAAYSDLPAHRFASTPPDFRVRLVLAPAANRQTRPPAISMLSGPDILGAATESSNFALLSVEQRSALICVTPRMLAFPYHARYELLEFAVFTLASRAQGLVPLHAACVGIDGKGIILMGDTGAGKTTVSLQCLLRGFDFLAEDSVFVAPASMRATGVANFLHLRSDSLRWVEGAQQRMIRRSPVIRRRSGVEKFEVSLRRKQFRLAPKPLKIVAVAFLTAAPSRPESLLRPVTHANCLRRMAELQGYGASLPQWRKFAGNLRGIETVEVRRPKHPSQVVEALRSLITKA